MRRFLVLALFLLATVMGCDGFTTFNGKVTDPAGKPLADADVKLIYKPDDPTYRRINSTKTDANGLFSVQIVHSPSKNHPIRLEVSKEGFQDHAANLTSMGTYAKGIVLQPAKK